MWVAKTGVSSRLRLVTDAAALHKFFALPPAVLLPILKAEWWDGYDVVDVLLDLEDQFAKELNGMELEPEDTN